MIAVIGSFRFPPEAVERARWLMRAVMAATLAEPGCRAYSYAEDVREPGLFRVSEEWDSREALEAHFATERMRQWQQDRTALGFHGREISAYQAGEQIAL